MRAVAWVGLAACGAAFQLPGVAPKGYRTRERVPLLVSKVSSTKTQIPYDYYALPFCKPRRKALKAGGGETGADGDALRESLYEVEAKIPDGCKILCRKDHSKGEMRLFRAMIDNEYRVAMAADGLPVAMRVDHYVARGFPVGFAVADRGGRRDHYLYNHVRLTFLYHEEPGAPGARVVGFEVEPMSVKHAYDEGDEPFGPMTTLKTCNEMAPARHRPETFQDVDEAQEVVYTYDVFWVRSETRWAERWDAYLNGDPNDEIHYFSIINSLMIVVFLTAVVAMIMLRTLRKDISSYNLEADDEEESGWKLLHGDVFRPPATLPMVLAVFAGTGVQVFLVALSVMALALLGFLAPSNRGGLLAGLVVLFVLYGGAAGYASARVYKLCRGQDWKRTTLLGATLFPATVLVVAFVLEAALRAQGAAPTASVGATVAGLLLWVGVCLPLVLAGSYVGFKAPALEVPTKTKQIPRVVPPQKWYSHAVFAVAFGGVLPFGAVCIELFFIMSALWLHQIYYVFGFLVAVLLILTATCAEMAIVLTYFQLCNEDYRWWWRSFLCSGSAAAYLFLYSVWYFDAKLDIPGGLPSLVYFGYMALASFTFFLLCGAIGFFAALWFNLQIYAAIKVD
ncbi:hypothetical protein AURANDRAFT_28353 [Aureococcus anophagefferens]|uniref:Transmembrane 9 superfamily member n=1 Tax=Aureococcus anophagefferens TaxID=44056 RepID=F0YDB2_AURAN|nr:hypothetical protein AURANDRAFT_28353 [Aureococcus anophagefferens]EGB07032.1 hypothetical protein AURANDRAFT_28353 [Aureococcus anophagefferens]|eukprot:XP_009038269.1 hypothetical protein AURANDRAFT_28353 [Aureococcus anophagefferens]